MSPLRSKADMLGFILKSVAINPRLLGDCNAARGGAEQVGTDHDLRECPRGVAR